MKKQVKIITTIFMIVTILVSLANVVCATTITGVIDGMKNGQADTAGITNFGAKIVAVLQTVGIVVAVVVLLILGIKYLMGSAEEKAEYKKTMIPYVVGAILIFSATTIVKIIYGFANGLN